MATDGVGMTSMTSLADKDVDSGLLRYAWGSEVWVQGLREERILGNKDITGTIKVGPTPISLPTDKMIIDVTGDMAPGARSLTVARRLALSGLGVFGRASRMGVAAAEENQSLEYMKAFSNDYFKAVTGEDYGINFRELSPYGLHKVVKQDLSRWAGGLYGMFARQAFCEGYSANLASTPVSQTQYINPNCWIIGHSQALQPVTSGTAATFKTRLCDAIKHMTSGNALFTVTRLISLVKAMENGDRYFETLNVGGKNVMVLFMHPDDYYYLWDPSVTGSYASYYTSVAANNDIQKVLPGAEMLVCDRLLCVLDPRAPTLTVTGTSGGGYTTSFGYMKQGRRSTRTTGTTANTHLNVNIMAGANALMYLETEAPHYVNQTDDYEQMNNTGLAGAFGFALTACDIDTTSGTGDINGNSTLHSEGSMLVLSQRA